MASRLGSGGQQRSVRVATTGAVVTALGSAYVINPNTTHVPLCPFHAMTGLWCPLCGSTRAVYGLLHADFGAALRDNALFVLAAPVAAVFMFFWLAGRPGMATTPKLSWMVAVLLVGFGVFRNLPVGSWLAPSD